MLRITDIVEREAKYCALKCPDSLDLLYNVWAIVVRHSLTCEGKVNPV